MADPAPLTRRNDRAIVAQHKPLWNLAALAYTLAGYAGAIALMVVPRFWWNVVGTLILAHCLVLSTYLTHDLLHGNIFATGRRNAVAGTVMLWLNGGCYGRFRDLVRQHMAHHVAKVDREALDVPHFLARCPGPLRAAILALEWLHLPVLSLVIQARAVTRSLCDPRRLDERRHAAAVLAVRTLLFAGFGALSLRGLLGYFQGYLTAILVLRFGDAFQHTYDVVPVGADVPARDAGYEQANTFTPLLSRRRPRLNLILLNFGYHNAHHARMSCPWHSLHELDRALFGAPHDHQIDLGTQLRNFHRFRMERILHGNRASTAGRGRPIDELRGTLTIPLFVKI